MSLPKDEMVETLLAKLTGGAHERAATAARWCAKSLEKVMHTDEYFMLIRDAFNERETRMGTKQPELWVALGLFRAAHEEDPALLACMLDDPAINLTTSNILVELAVGNAVSVAERLGVEPLSLLEED